MRQINTHTDTEESTEEEDEQTNTRNRCSECGGDVYRDDSQGELVCSECGLVIDDTNIDPGPDWRAFGSEEKKEKSRVGAPVTNMMHDKGLSTNIGWKDQDAYGNQLSERKRKKVQRLRTWNERFRTKDSTDRNLKQALGEIDRMASALGLPENVRETASVIYRRALNENLLPGRSIEGVATASLYAAARRNRTPRSIDEFVQVSRIERKEITRTYRYISRELGLKIKHANPKQFIPRYTTELNTPQEVEIAAKELIDDAAEEGITSGKDPTGLAAAAIYAAALLANKKLTQAEVGNVAGVSEVTIRNRYQELLEVQDAGLVN